MLTKVLHVTWSLIIEFNKPEALKWTDNVAENYKLFEEDVLVFYEVTETTAKPEKVQVTRLLNLNGSDERQNLQNI